MAVLNLVRDISLASFFGAWFPSATSPGLASEPAGWLYDFLLHPMIFGYFCWIQGAGNRLIKDLLDEGLFESEKLLQPVLAKGKERLQNPQLSIVATFLSLVCIIWFILAFTSSPLQPPYPSWVTVHPAIMWIIAPVGFVVVYALILFVYDLVVIILVINQLFSSQRIRIEPLNSDGAGGLGSIGRFSANLGYIIGAAGVGISLSIIQVVSVVQAPAILFNDYFLIAGTILYLILAPLIFIAPLWIAHTKMVEYRNRLIAEISTEFDTVFARLRASFSDEPDSIELSLKKVRLLDSSTLAKIALLSSK